MTVNHYEYEQSSEAGRERHIRVPYSRLADQTPTIHDPFKMTARTAGTMRRRGPTRRRRTPR